MIDSKKIPISEGQALALANLLHELRPRWSVPSMMKMLADDRDVAPFPDLVRAAVTVALDPKAETPAVIFMTGKHWLTPEQATSPAHTAALGNDTSPDCPAHPGVKEWACRPCKKPTPPPPDLRDRIAAAAEAARAERAAKLTNQEGQAS